MPHLVYQTRAVDNAGQGTAPLYGDTVYPDTRILTNGYVYAGIGAVTITIQNTAATGGPKITGAYLDQADYSRGGVISATNMTTGGGFAVGASQTYSVTTTKPWIRLRVTSETKSPAALGRALVTITSAVVPEWFCSILEIEERIGINGYSDYNTWVSIINDISPDMDRRMRGLGSLFLRTYVDELFDAGKRALTRIPLQGYTIRSIDHILENETLYMECKVTTYGGNITLSGTQTIDGVAVVAADIVLVTSQTDATQNGPYVVASGAWTRHTATTKMKANAQFYVTDGTTYNQTRWILNNSNPVLIGTDSLTITQQDSGQRYVPPFWRIDQPCYLQRFDENGYTTPWKRFVKVSYTAGYSSAAELSPTYPMPADLRNAALKLAAKTFSNRLSVGATQVSGGGQNVTISGEGPYWREIESILIRYQEGWRFG